MKVLLQSRLRSWLICIIAIAFTLPVKGADPSHNRDSGTMQMSVVTLIANPTKYNGKHIRVVGFLDVEFEGNALYLHQEDYQYSISKNAIELVLTKAQEDQFKRLSLNHVILEGDFGLSSDEMFSGSLKHITRLEVWPAHGSR